LFVLVAILVEKVADRFDVDTIPKRAGVVILEIIPKGREALNNEAIQDLDDTA